MGLKKAQNASSRKRVSRRFEALRIDYDKITGPRRSVTFTRSTPTDTTYNRSVLSNGNLSQIKREHVTEGAGYIDQYLDEAVIEDSHLEVVVKNNFHWLYMRHWRSEPTVEAQLKMGAITASGGGLGKFEYGYVMPIADAMYVSSYYGKPRAAARYCRLTGRGFSISDGWKYGGGLPGALDAKGPRMTIEECRDIRTFTPGMTVQEGEFIQATIASVNDNRVYQCIQSGVVSTGTVWPVWVAARYGDLASGDTSQPFSDGTAQFICVGSAVHSDALQWVGGGFADIYRCYIDGSPNACLIVQSWINWASVKDGQNAPTRCIVVEQCTLMTPRNDTTDIYCYVGAAPGGIDPNDSRASGGLYLSGGVWKENPEAWRSRAWAIQWIDNTWLDQPIGGRPTNAAAMILTASTQFYHGQMFVDSKDRWKEIVANQFNLNVSTDAELLENMLTGNIDWNVFMATATINQSVLNARKAMGITYGACDARTAMIWQGNRDQVGNIIHPTSWANFTPSFSAQGYYTGM